MEKKSLHIHKALPPWALLIVVGGYSIFCALIILNIKKFENQITQQEHEGEIFVQQTEINKLRNELGYQIEKEALLSTELQGRESEIQKLDRRVDNYREDIKELEKLTETDPVLLQKYSKVFFLNEHYTPKEIDPIDPKFVDATKEDLKINGEVKPFLDEMLKDAEDDGINLRILSAYRSFGEQSELKARYSVSYGTAANTFSADQGYSEHQLGTTVDFTVAERAGDLTNFHNSSAYEWLKANAYKYGFILSYDENNSYYVFEPWHWRFVGKDLAKYIFKNNLTFYTIDQRKINEYLVDIFED